MQFVKQMSLMEFATILIFHKSLSTVVLQIPQIMARAILAPETSCSHCLCFKSSNNLKHQPSKLLGVKKKETSLLKETKCVLIIALEGNKKRFQKKKN